MKKPLPIGVDDFKKLIASGYYYVDKTLFIKELLDRNPVNSVPINRPIISCEENWPMNLTGIGK